MVMEILAKCKHCHRNKPGGYYSITVKDWMKDDFDKGEFENLRCYKCGAVLRLYGMELLE